MNEELDINASPSMGQSKGKKRGKGDFSDFFSRLTNRNTKPIAYVFFLFGTALAGGVYFAFSNISEQTDGGVDKAKQKYFGSSKPPAFVLASELYGQDETNREESRRYDPKANTQDPDNQLNSEKDGDQNRGNDSREYRNNGYLSYQVQKQDPVIQYKNQMFENAINILAKTNFRGETSSSTKDNIETKKKHPGNIFLTAGSVIPGVLQTGINSDLKGMIVGRVTRDVYDTATGDFVLIPAGAKILGSYDDAVVLGQNRILMMWNRIILPQGRGDIDLSEMRGHDLEGYAGLGAIVDNHYAEKFGGALLLSLISTGFQMSQSPNSGDPNAGDILSQEIGKEFHQTSSQIIKQGMQIKPTLKNLPSSEFLILVNQDLGLKEWLW